MWKGVASRWIRRGENGRSCRADCCVDCQPSDCRGVRSRSAPPKPSSGQHPPPPPFSSASRRQPLPLCSAMMDLDPRLYENVSVSDSDVRNIVLSYLMHNCFKETAEVFVSSTGLQLPVDYSTDVDKRKAILNFVLEGNALKAIELTEELAPKLLENDMDLHFDLLSLHFIELVRARKCTGALEFGQKRLTSFGKVPKYVEKLEDFMALLAYEEPEKSPMFYLLSPEYRQKVADGLNRAVLAHANLPAYSSLERVVQQAAVVRQYLQQEVDKDSYPPFSLKAFLSK